MIDFAQMHKDHDACCQKLSSVSFFGSKKERNAIYKEFPVGTRYNPSSQSPQGWQPQIGIWFAERLKHKWGKNYLHLHRHIEMCAIPKIQKLDGILCQGIESELLIRFDGDGKSHFDVPDARYPDGRFYFTQKLTYSWVGVWSDKANWEKSEYPDAVTLIFAMNPECAFNPNDEIF